MNPTEGKGERRQGAEWISLTEALRLRILDGSRNMKTMDLVARGKKEKLQRVA